VPENAGLLARFGTPLDPSHSSIPDIRRFAATATQPELDRVVAALQAMLAVTPGERTILVVLGQVLDAADRSKEGAGYLRQAVAAAPESSSARLLLADVLGRTQDIAAARAEIGTVLAREAENSTAWLVLADIEWRAGDPDAARRALERVVQLDPWNGLAHDRLGDFFAQQGRLAEAEYHYRRALQSRPGDPNLQRKLAAVREGTAEAADR
jgi:predicted Zn-dependent protease